MDMVYRTEFHFHTATRLGMPLIMRSEGPYCSAVVASCVALVLLHSAGLAAAHRGCQGLNQLSTAAGQPEPWATGEDRVTLLYLPTRLGLVVSETGTPDSKPGIIDTEPNLNGRWDRRL
eukprot:scaffold162898_cov25-Tisochrysis_lutea.AAC.1